MFLLTFLSFLVSRWYWLFLSASWINGVQRSIFKMSFFMPNTL